MIDISKYTTALQSIIDQLKAAPVTGPHEAYHPEVLRIGEGIMPIYDEAKAFIEASTEDQASKDAAWHQILVLTTEIKRLAPPKVSQPMMPPEV